MSKKPMSVSGIDNGPRRAWSFVVTYDDGSTHRLTAVGMNDNRLYDVWKQLKLDTKA